MKIPSWIVLVKYDSWRGRHFLCERCGQTRPVYLPAAVDDFMKQARAFVESHKNCK